VAIAVYSARCKDAVCSTKEIHIHEDIAHA
jgi:hypothetical protein